MRNPLQSSSAFPIRFASAALAALLLLAPAVQAQEAAAVPIEQQMSEAEFQAAGLDRLDPEQLAKLNAWLNRAIRSESDKAAELATTKIKEENRGFLTFGSNEAITGRLAGEFRGFGKGRNYTLENGQVWQQQDSVELHGVRLDRPEVKIAPGALGVWYMNVGKYNTRAKVQRIK